MPVASILAAALALTAPPPADPLVNAVAKDQAVMVHGRLPITTGQPASLTRPAGPHYVYERLIPMFCGTGTGGGEPSNGPTTCVEGVDSGAALRQCADGTRVLGPLVRRLVDEDGAPLGAWEQVDNGGCPGDPSPAVVLSTEEFRRLPLAASVPAIQPSDGRALVSLGVAVHTDASAQELSTTLLGVPVRVRATPVSYAWDFGDGTPVVTTTAAGAEWPHQAALGEYPEPGTYELVLTTTWRGEFQVDGAGPWLPVTGTATTTSAPVVISVETAPARLVAES